MLSSTFFFILRHKPFFYRTYLVQEKERLKKTQQFPVPFCHNSTLLQAKNVLETRGDFGFWSCFRTTGVKIGV
jgi:hypothetical protein